MNLKELLAKVTNLKPQTQTAENQQVTELRNKIKEKAQENLQKEVVQVGTSGTEIMPPEEPQVEQEPTPVVEHMPFFTDLTTEELQAQADRIIPIPEPLSYRPLTPDQMTAPTLPEDQKAEVELPDVILVDYKNTVDGGDFIVPHVVTPIEGEYVQTSKNSFEFKEKSKKRK